MYGMTQHPQKHHPSWLSIFGAFGLALVLSVFLVGCSNGSDSGTTSSDTTEASSDAATTDADTTTAATETTVNSTFDNDNIDYAETFPSWNPDSESLKKLVEYVKSVTDESSPDYVAPEDRIATFDMDGTIICEKAPFYADWCLLLNRVLDNPSYNEPEYKPSEEAVKQCQEIRDCINAGEKPTEEMEKNKARLIASEFEGMTPEEFREYALNFATQTNAVGFDGMTYAESFYQPMLEVMYYLQNNYFDLWMVSACEREFVRALVPTAVYMPLDHIIGTDVSFEAAKQGDEEYDKHNMEQGEDVVLGEELGQETAKAGKPIAITREIGKRPILSFGNSSGDYAMLNFAQSNPDHKGMGVLVLCDDTEREYGDEERATEQSAEAEKEGWNLFHMSDQDWAAIYGEGVTKTQYPGASESKDEGTSDEAKDDEAKGEEETELADAA